MRRLSVLVSSVLRCKGVTKLSRFSNRPLALLASVGIITGLMLAAVSYQDSRNLIMQGQDRARAAMSRGLVLALSDQLVVNDYAGMESRLIQAMTDESIASAMVTDRAGKVLVHLRREKPSENPELFFEPRQVAPPAKDSRNRIGGPVETRWTAIEAGELLGWLELRTWSTNTEMVLAFVARQYLLLGLLSAALLSTVLVTTYRRSLRRAHERERLLHKQNAELASKAFVDPLTGVYNRRGIEHEIQTILNPAEQRHLTKLAICMIDLDDFKPVNDFYGHAVGDQLLKAVCLRLQDCLRDRDLIGRIGGDEFVVVLLDCHSADLALTVTQRIMTSLQRPFPLGDLLVRIGASAGVALNGDTPDAGIEVLLQRADSAMYQAKRAGKGAAVVAPAPEGPADDGVDPKPSALDRAPANGCEES